jgi:hypothetical protein
MQKKLLGNYCYFFAAVYSPEKKLWQLQFSIAGHCSTQLIQTSAGSDTGAVFEGEGEVTGKGFRQHPL